MSVGLYFCICICVSFTNHLSLYWFCSVCTAFCFWSKLCSCAVSLHVAGVLQVSGMRIYTSGDMEAVNGTDVRLKCTFHSSATINPNSIVISWSFRPLKPGREESVSVFVFVRKWDQTLNLPDCVREHPPPQPTERGVDESSGSLQSVQASLCVSIENREKKMQQVWVYVLSFFLCENKILSVSRLSLVWLSFCDNPTNQTYYCSDEIYPSISTFRCSTTSSDHILQ